MADLEDPVSGFCLYLVASAHVSQRAALEAREQLRELSPEYCAVELDRERLKSALLRVQHWQGLLEGSGAVKGRRDSIPDTPWKVLKAVYGKQGPAGLLYIFLDSFSYSLLGVPYGVDMLTAISEAQKLGVPLVPIDRPSNITFARALAQGQSLHKAKKHLDRIHAPPASQSDPSERQKAQMRRMRELVKAVAHAAGCPDPELALSALVDTAHSAAQGAAVSPDALGTIRECGNKVVELVRTLALHPDRFQREGGPLSVEQEEEQEEQEITGPITPELAKQLLARAVMLESFPPAVARERDLIMAQNLRLLTTRGSAIGVVGAAHVPGIKQRWSEALSQESLVEAKGYFSVGKAPALQPANEILAPPILESFSFRAPGGQEVESYVPSMPQASQGIRRGVPVGPLLVGAGTLGLLIYRPRATATILAPLALLAAGGQYAVASMVARAGKVAVRLEEAAERLTLERQSEDFLQS